jgi:hypothetical protein
MLNYLVWGAHARRVRSPDQLQLYCTDHLTVRTLEAGGFNESPVSPCAPVQRVTNRLTAKTRLECRALKNRSSLPLFPSVIRNQGGPEATMRPARVGSTPIVMFTLMPDLRSAIVPFCPFTLISINGVTMNVLVSFWLVTVIEFAVTFAMTWSCCSAGDTFFFRPPAKPESGARI